MSMHHNAKSIFPGITANASTGLPRSLPDNSEQGNEQHLCETHHHD